MKKIAFYLILLSGFICRGCYYDNEEDLYQFVQEQQCDVAGTAVTFSANVVSILTTHCIRCHRTGREDGNVNLEGYTNVKFYADNGSLYGTANHEAGYPIMPTTGVKIPACEIEQLRMWIDKGAPND